MTQLLTLEQVDVDGAIREAEERVRGDSRADFLRKGLIAGGGLAAAAAVLGAGEAKAVTARDVAVLQFAQTLEHLEAAFYTEAVRMGALEGDVLRFARIVGSHERAHVAFLAKALGSSAIRKPRFDFRGTTENQARFVATSIILEETGVKAYKGQAPRIDSDSILAAALSIHSVEARHASWIRHIAGKPPAPTAFDPAATLSQVLAAVAGTRFLAGPVRPVTGGAPLFTG